MSRFISSKSSAVPYFVWAAPVIDTVVPTYLSPPVSQVGTTAILSSYLGGRVERHSLPHPRLSRCDRLRFYPQLVVE